MSRQRHAAEASAKRYALLSQKVVSACTSHLIDNVKNILEKGNQFEVALPQNLFTIWFQRRIVQREEEEAHRQGRTSVLNSPNNPVYLNLWLMACLATQAERVKLPSIAKWIRVGSLSDGRTWLRGGGQYRLYAIARRCY